ncbi:DUF4296 domain-containing protein [Xanthomarina sp. F1114]|uniref:DUF4296 domain-containing protein n=1 Tax=Xanthomarina sp. F1114 TaxID=2996019 RepID=UPI00225E1D7D|nr:DUF4296 domain-containing protein [Xanthomarina sp. F1114]MCX7547006.1 DUF4296 domain-containing protein [Xanthomarina sp. F1114]
MKNFITLLVLVAFVCSCSNFEKRKKPKNLISKEKMVSILLDVSIVNSAKGLNKITLENNGVVPDQYIYQKYNIDSLQFISSNEYYTYNLNDYEDIISKVNDSLKTLKEIYDAALEVEKIEERKLDSIKKTKRPTKALINTNVLQEEASSKN